MGEYRHRPGLCPRCLATPRPGLRGGGPGPPPDRHGQFAGPGAEDCGPLASSRCRDPGGGSGYQDPPGVPYGPNPLGSSPFRACGRRIPGRGLRGRGPCSVGPPTPVPSELARELEGGGAGAQCGAGVGAWCRPSCCCVFSLICFFFFFFFLPVSFPSLCSHRLACEFPRLCSGAPCAPLRRGEGMRGIHCDAIRRGSLLATAGLRNASCAPRRLLEVKNP